MPVVKEAGPGEERRFTGWHMLAVVLLFFGTIIAVNIAMILAATGTFPGLVVKNSYVASQHYNDLLATDRAQDRLGWRMELEARDGVLRFRLNDRDGVAQRRLATTALAGRPSTTRDDRALDLAETGDGYIAGAPLPAGQWDVDIEAKRDGEVLFRGRKRLIITRGE